MENKQEYKMDFNVEITTSFQGNDISAQKRLSFQKFIENYINDLESELIDFLENDFEEIDVYCHTDLTKSEAENIEEEIEEDIEE